ncbi:MAG: hypothetical protein QOF36_1036 [Microbacteriaceae bacterium]|nr:hypothetical protein [Microbacteriaceae bacterium]
MTNTYSPVPSDEGNVEPTKPRGKADVAREQAGHVAETAADSGQRVAGVAKDEASKVATEVKTQAKDLFQEAQADLRDQAAKQQERVAAGLRSISDELEEMASNSQSSGTATDLVQQAAARTGSIASWLDARDPGSLLDEVRSFARRRPGVFIAIAAAAGVLAGRLTRSIASGAEAASGTGTGTEGSPSPSTPRYTAPRVTSKPIPQEPRITVEQRTPVQSQTIGEQP